MEVTIFDSGDAPYLKWMEKHPGGYVLNVKRNPSTSFGVFHESGCSHISGVVSGHRADSHTKHEKIKVCAEETEPLIEWMLEYRPKAVAKWMCETQPDEERDIGPCGSCAPEVEIDDFGFYDHPEEETEPEVYKEGSTATVEVNRHERNRAARQACIDEYGPKCQVCGLEFEERYGEIGEGFIHIHHEVPLSKTDGEGELTTDDLKPVCPNCHAMLHQEDPPLTIDQLRGRLRTEE
jgi:hypothetical protein